MLVIAVLAVVPGLGQRISVVDQAGRTVAIPAPPARVASVFGVATAYVYALGAGDLLVGARYLGLPDSPLARQVMARIDPVWEGKAFPAEVTVETLVALRAELVLAGTRHLPLAGLLGEVGIPAAVYAPETFAAVREATRLTGAVLGREEEAHELIELFDEVLAEVAQRMGQGGSTLPRVLFLGTAPLRVAVGGMYQTQLIALAGGRSVAEGLPGASWQSVNLEQILVWNPDVILIAPYGTVRPDDIVQNQDWQSVTAVKTGRVWKLPQLLFAWDTPIPESVLGILWVAERLHPGRVGLDIAGLASRFYSQFYGVDLSEDEVALFSGD
ncbi:MAG: ABC transporter substrate-binding protein [Candidatus Bipolaricaulota bacterium]